MRPLRSADSALSYYLGSKISDLIVQEYTNFSVGKDVGKGLILYLGSRWGIA